MPARPSAARLQSLLGAVAAVLAASSLCCADPASPAAGDGGPVPVGGRAGDGTLGGQSPAPPDDGCQRCPSYAAPVALGRVPPALDELSGLAASHRHPGVLYAHNDSANTTVLFAIDESARVLGEMRLSGADSEDLEAVAVAPCPAPPAGPPASPASCLYLGDIGDNDRERQTYALYVIPEPERLDPGQVAEVPFQHFPFVYPDGPHNAETLLVDGRSGRVFLITKGREAIVYELPTPLVPATPATLARVGPLELPSAEPVTDGSFHPCGDRLLVRTGEALFELVRPQGAALEAIFGAAPVLVPLPAEPKGEAVTYAPDGMRYFSSGETVDGAAPAALSAARCAGGA